MALVKALVMALVKALVMDLVMTLVMALCVENRLRATRKSLVPNALLGNPYGGAYS